MQPTGAHALRVCPVVHSWVCGGYGGLQPPFAGQTGPGLTLGHPGPYVSVLVVESLCWAPAFSTHF